MEPDSVPPRVGPVDEGSGKAERRRRLVCWIERIVADTSQRYAELLMNDFRLSGRCERQNSHPSRASCQGVSADLFKYKRGSKGCLAASGQALHETSSPWLRTRLSSGPGRKSIRPKR